MTMKAGARRSSFFVFSSSSLISSTSLISLGGDRGYESSNQYFSAQSSTDVGRGVIGAP